MVFIFYDKAGKPVDKIDNTREAAKNYATKMGYDTFMSKEELRDENLSVNADIAAGKPALEVYKEENPTVSEALPYLAQSMAKGGGIDSALAASQKDVWSLPGRSAATLAGLPLAEGGTLGTTVEEGGSFLRDPALLPFLMASAAFTPTMAGLGYQSLGLPGAVLAGAGTEAALGAGTQASLGDPSVGLDGKTTLLNAAGGALGGAGKVLGKSANISRLFPDASPAGKTYLMDESMRPSMTKTLVGGTDVPQVEPFKSGSPDKMVRNLQTKEKFIGEMGKSFAADVKGNVGKVDITGKKVSDFEQPIVVGPQSNDLLGVFLDADPKAAEGAVRATIPGQAVGDLAANILDDVYTHAGNLKPGTYNTDQVVSSLNTAVQDSKKAISEFEKKTPSKLFKEKLGAGVHTMEDAKAAFEEVTGQPFPITVTSTNAKHPLINKWKGLLDQQLKAADDIHLQNRPFTDSQLKEAQKAVMDYLKGKGAAHDAKAEEAVMLHYKFLDEAMLGGDNILPPPQTPLLPSNNPFATSYVPNATPEELAGKALGSKIAKGGGIPRDMIAPMLDAASARTMNRAIGPRATDAGKGYFPNFAESMLGPWAGTARRVGTMENSRMFGLPPKKSEK